jgi:ankyrin repeat protein
VQLKTWYVGQTMSSDDGEEGTRLHFAAQAGDLRVVSALLEAGENPNAFDDLGKTPLHYVNRPGNPGGSFS